MVVCALAEALRRWPLLLGAWDELQHLIQNALHTRWLPLCAPRCRPKQNCGSLCTRPSLQGQLRCVCPNVTERGPGKGWGSILRVCVGWGLALSRFWHSFGEDFGEEVCLNGGDQTPTPVGTAAGTQSQLSESRSASQIVLQLSLVFSLDTASLPLNLSASQDHLSSQPPAGTHTSHGRRALTLRCHSATSPQQCWMWPAPLQHPHQHPHQHYYHQKQQHNSTSTTTSRRCRTRCTHWAGGGPSRAWRLQTRPSGSGCRCGPTWACCGTAP